MTIDLDELERVLERGERLTTHECHELIALARKAGVYERALREIDDLLRGELPITHQVKEIARKALEDKMTINLDKLEREVRAHQDSPSDKTMLELIVLARKGQVLAKHIATQEHYRQMQERAEVLEQEVERLKNRVDELTFQLAEKKGAIK